MKKDVYKYFVSMQKQMNDANKILEKVNKEIEEGKVSDEQRANFETYYYGIYANYNRVSYIVHLLGLPPEFIQRFQEKSALKRQKKFEEEMRKAHADMDSVIEENEEALREANDLLEEVQKADE